jgi:tellurite resistance protein TehA-like permease
MPTNVFRLTDRVSPASFTVVMATGIVSIAAHVEGVAVLDVALFALNVVLYGALCVLTATGPARGRHARAEFTDLAVVAATCVLGAQALVIADSVPVATALLLAGIGLWLVLGYRVVARRPPAASVDGGWLLAVVATQSIAVLLALLSGHWHQPLRLDANFAAVSLWLVGAMLYGLIISLICLRLAFLRVTPADLTPQYWINMGAMAISALAGSLLIDDAPVAPFLMSLRPFLGGLTVAFWAVGTWWIPILVAFAVWRYGVHHLPLGYDPLYWSAVFPLGMYAVSTTKLADAESIGLLAGVGHTCFWVALAAWVLTWATLASSARSRPE